MIRFRVSPRPQLLVYERSAVRPRIRNILRIPVASEPVRNPHISWSLLNIL